MNFSNVITLGWTSLVAYSMVQGYLLSIIFPGYRFGSAQAKRILSFISVICAFLLTEELLELTIGYDRLPHMIYLASPLWYLLGPLIYFYIRLYVTGTPVSWKDWWHAIPAIWMISNTFEFYLLPAEYKLYYLQKVTTGKVASVHNWNYIIYSLQSTFYLVTGWYLLKQFQPQSRSKSQHMLLRQLIFGLSLITFFAYFTLFSLNIASELLSFVCSLYVIWTSGFLLLLFFRSIRSHKELYFIGSPPKIGSGKKQKTNDDYGLLLTLMEDQKLYRNPNFEVADLSRELNFSKNYTHQLLRKYTGQNFREFVNHYRVKDAKEKLISPLSKQFTIESIACDAGFNSVATFYRVFKRIEGTTPKTFIGH